MSYLGVPPFGQTVRTTTELTATAAQTTFTPAGGYLPGYIDVFMNGVLLDSSDYTATNGSTVVLTAAAALDDEIKTLAYFPVSMVDTYRKSEVDSGFLPAVNPSYTGTLTGGTGVVNLGSGQVYKDASGNVGIGTSSPSQKLDVAGTVRVANTTGNKTFLIGQSTPSGNDGASLEFQNSNTARNWAIRSNFNVGGALEFCRSSAAGGTSYEAPAAILDSSGNLLVGTTSSWGGSPKMEVRQTTNSAWGLSSYNAGTTTGGALLLRVDSTSLYLAGFYYTGSVLTGTISTNGTNTTYGTSSDYRLKENIAPMTGALAKVAALKPVTYTWKSTGEADQGFIAHELQEVCPSAVTGEKDAVNEDGSIKPQGIDTSFLVATLTAAIQELKAINDAQAQTIESLTARVVALEGQA